jgi:N-methylhydantoinase A
VTERILSSGEELIPVNLDEIRQLSETLKWQGIEAVAVCFLNAYRNPDHEKIVGGLLKELLPDCYISLSHKILREYREYERTSTTVINSYVGPKVSQYIKNLHSKMDQLGFKGTLSIMQSNGGIMSPDTAISKPVNMLESGPVGGIIASAAVGKALGHNNVIVFDMGGTTAKASLIYNGQVTLSEMYYIGGEASGHPVMIPVVDVVEIGTGGGSIAWIDEVGVLKVGPHSAGSDPAPICYGKGGTEPTFTDANVILGRIGAEDFLGGEMKLDKESAYKGIQSRIAQKLNIDPLSAAKAIVEIAINHMSLAVREVSVKKGYDPREFALLASGGAGPLCATAIARELHVPIVIIPRFPAHFSALGMLLADQRHDFVRTYYTQLDKNGFDHLYNIYKEMVEEAKHLASSETIITEQITYQGYLDIRYVGQEFTLPVPFKEEQLKDRDVSGIQAAFNQIHQQQFGHMAEDEPIEIINIRLSVTGIRKKPTLPELNESDRDPRKQYRLVYFDDVNRPVNCPVYDRESLPPGFEVTGPALIQEYASTTVLYDGDMCQVSETGELIIFIGGAVDD